MRWRTLVVLGPVLVLAAAATVDGFQGGAAPRESGGAEAASDQPADDRLRGPGVPAAGALPGSLVLAEPGSCRVRTLSFATVVLGEAGPPTACELWASPAGRFAVATTARVTNPFDPRPLALVSLGERSEEADGDFGEARGQVVWSPDGAEAAWCVPSGETVVRNVESGAERRMAGCSPAFDPEGGLLTVPADPLDARLLRDGETVLTRDDLVRGTDAVTAAPVIQVSAFAVAPRSRIAVSVLVFEALGSVIFLELWEGKTLEASFRLPTLYGTGSSRLGQYLRFSPDGNELAVGFRPGPGRVTIVDLRLAGVAMPELDQQGFAWSPDAAWLAIATEGRIEVYGDTRDEPVYTLPVAAGALDWAGPAG